MTAENDLPLKSTPKACSHAGLKWMLALTFFMAAIALGAAGFLGYLTVKDFFQGKSEFSQLSQSLQTQQAANKTTLETFQKSLSAQEEVQINVQKQLSTLQENSQSIEKSYLTIETDYLLRLAQYQLTFQKNLPQAISLLQEAQKQLSTSHDTSLEPLKTAINDNIQSLSVLSPLDTPTMLKEFSEVSAKLPELFQQKISAGDVDNATPPTKPQEGPWYHRLWGNIKNLKNLVVIRQNDKPNLLPDEMMQIQEQIQSALVKAQWALLNHQDTVYLNSLNDAVSQLQNTFKGNSPLADTLVASLKDLLQVSVNPNYPQLVFPKIASATPVIIPPADNNNTPEAPQDAATPPTESH